MIMIYFDLKIKKFAVRIVLVLKHFHLIKVIEI